MPICLSVFLSVSLYALSIVTLLAIYILLRRPFLTIFLLLSKSDSCLSLHTGRPESAETSHFDGGSCHCYIWNLLGARRNCAQLRQLQSSQYQSTRIRCCSFAGTVQFCCQPVRVRFGQQKFPRKAKRNDMG